MTDDGFGLGISSIFRDNLKEIDSIFETSFLLQKLYDSSLESIPLDNLPYLQKQKIKNSILVIQNIQRKSIEKSEQSSWNRLYGQALILVVSISEQLLKEIFERLLFTNLENIKEIDDRSFKFKTVREKSFNLTKKDWIEIIKTDIYSDLNPSEKINFQNIKSIQGIFEAYFNIDFEMNDSLSKILHKFYQVRHVIVHNGGIIDKRFLENLSKANISNSYKVRERLIINKSDYKECKEGFDLFFKLLEKSILVSKLKYEEIP